MATNEIINQAKNSCACVYCVAGMCGLTGGTKRCPADEAGLEEAGEDTLCYAEPDKKMKHLYNSDNDYMSAEDLGVSQEEYDAAIIESLEEDTAEGYIYVHGVKVYAK